MVDSRAPRVVMVALDAMELPIFEHLLESGALPHLARFRREAAHATVRSDGATLHGSVWPTFATGESPAHHGVYFWTQWLQEEMGYAHNSHPSLNYEPFWGRIAAAGHPVTVVDAPYVPLARHPNAIQVSDWGTHDDVKPDSWPAGYAAIFRKRFGKHPLVPDTGEVLSPNDKLAMVRTMRRGIAMRSAALERLLRERPDGGFHLMVYGETHKAGHYLAAPQQLSEEMDNLGGYAHMLAALDEAWPRIEAAAGPEATLMVVALHGLLEHADYTESLAGQVLALALGHPAEVGVERADLLRKLRDRIPLPVHRAIWRRLPRRIRASRLGSRSSAAVDMEKDAVLRIVHDGHLALRKNLAGREREGRFSDEEAEAMLAKLEDFAAEFRTGEGYPAFEGVWRPREAFGEGPRLHRLPDALLLSNPNVKSARKLVGPHGVELTAQVPDVRNGLHNGRGFLFLRPGAGTTASVARAEIDNRDFAPSLLDRFGLAGGGQGTSFFA